MKLISCYIEGYGCIKEKEYAFCDGISAFFEENGSGKTTLASFIKAMFFGLKGYKENSSEFCERKRYFPFDSGKFGGNLTFEQKGRLYRIERFFDVKNEKKDTLRVYCGGEPTDELGSDIGRAVFGVDEESFRRTLFCGSEEPDMRSTASINMKMNMLLYGGSEGDGPEKALAALEKARKIYRPDRLGKNAAGLIPDWQKRADALRNRFENLSVIQKELEKRYSIYDGMRRELGELNERLAAAHKQSELAAHAEAYRRMLGELSALEAEAEALLKKYPLGVPARDEVEDIKQGLDAVKALKIKLEGVGFPQQSATRLAELERSFEESGVPEEQTLDEMRARIDALAALKGRAQAEELGQLTESQARIKEKFGISRPSDGELEEKRAALKGYGELKRSYDSLPDKTVIPSRTEPTVLSKGKYIGFAAVAAAIALIGAALIFFNVIGIGVALICIGAAALLTDAFVYLNRKMTLNGAAIATVTVDNPEKRELGNALGVMSEPIKRFLEGWGYFSDKGMEFDFDTLCADLERYRETVAAEESLRERRQELEREIGSGEQALNGFFALYGLSGADYGKALDTLKLWTEELKALRAQRTESEKREADLSARIREREEQLGAWATKYGFGYGFSEADADGVLSDIARLVRLYNEIDGKNRSAERFRAEKGIDPKLSYTKADTDALTEELAQKQEAYLGLGRQINADEAELEDIEGCASSLREAEERLAEYGQRYELLKEAHRFLELADQSMKDRYVRPVLEEFKKYPDALDAAIGARVDFTKELEPMFERKGELRSEKHLSSGQRALCALCFRLALIGNMYKDERPFIVMDDPFVSLDRVNTQRAMDILRSVSGEMQILYFTCHESRMPS
ncbi:MAG: AAA family ATPase [Clostridia bacterium]|nr:AAA family ATPase [Clostridia bacterium]